MPATPSRQAQTPQAAVRSTRTKIFLSIFIAIGLGAVALCAFLGFIAARLVPDVLEAQDEVQVVINQYMRAMARRDTQDAQRYLTHDNSLLLYNTLQQMVNPNNGDYAMFDRFQTLQLRNYSVKIVNGKTSVRIDGDLLYTNGYRGSLTAVLVKENGAWKIESIDIYIPPQKVQDYINQHPSVQTATPPS